MVCMNCLVLNCSICSAMPAAALPTSTGCWICRKHLLLLLCPACVTYCFSPESTSASTCLTPRGERLVSSQQSHCCAERFGVFCSAMTRSESVDCVLILHLPRRLLYYLRIKDLWENPNGGKKIYCLGVPIIPNLMKLVATQNEMDLVCWSQNTYLT